MMPSRQYWGTSGPKRRAGAIIVRHELEEIKGRKMKDLIAVQKIAGGRN